MFLKLWEEFEQQNILRPYKVIIWQSHNVLMISWHTSWGNDYQISKLYLNCYQYFYLFYLYIVRSKSDLCKHSSVQFKCFISVCPIHRPIVPPDTWWDNSKHEFAPRMMFWSQNPQSPSFISFVSSSLLGVGKNCPRIVKWRWTRSAGSSWGTASPPHMHSTNHTRPVVQLLNYILDLDACNACEKLSMYRKTCHWRTFPLCPVPKSIVIVKLWRLRLGVTWITEWNV